MKNPNIKITINSYLLEKEKRLRKKKTPLNVSLVKLSF